MFEYYNRNDEDFFSRDHITEAYQATADDAALFAEEEYEAMEREAAEDCARVEAIDPFIAHLDAYYNQDIPF